MARRRRHRGQDHSRFWIGLFKLVFFLGAVGLAGFYGYETGQKVMDNRTVENRDEITRLNGLLHDAQDHQSGLEATLRQVQQDNGDLRHRLDDLGVTDDLKDLLALIKTRIAAGQDARHLIAQLGGPAVPANGTTAPNGTPAGTTPGKDQANDDKSRNCHKGELRRVAVKLAGHETHEPLLARFNKDAVVVSAEGTPTQEADGTPSGNFDSKAEVSVTYALKDGKSLKASGKLPLSRDFKVDNVDYHVVVKAGALGKIDVLADRCDTKTP